MSASTSSSTGSSTAQALVLSGGGADGAYGVGVVEALAAGRSSATGHQSLDPGIFAGTSIGSFNAAFLAANWDHLGNASAGRLADVWRQQLAERPGSCGNGAYRIKASPTEYLDPRCYFPNPFSTALRLARDSASLGWEGLQRLVHAASSHDEGLVQRSAELVNFSSFVSREPWSRTIRRSIDFETIRRSSRQLRIVATNWATGKLRIFDNSNMSDTLGPLAIEASSALPGFYPPADVGSQPYIDGGVLLNTPLKPAIRAGGRELFVVYLDPDISAVPLSHLENTLETLYRSQQIAWAAKIRLDIAAARRINLALAWLRRARELGDTEGPLYRHMARRHRDLHALTIHRFSPREDFGGAVGLLDLDARRIERLMRQGFEDTVEHDCERAGCLLVDEESFDETPE